MLIKDSGCAWFKGFLSSRTQPVTFNGTLSSIKSCLVGIPQRNVLSLTLFNIHIDDLDTCFPEHLKVSTHTMNAFFVNAFFGKNIAK